MPTEAKQQMVAELRELFTSSPSAIVTDYRGLTVAEIGQVRRSLREQGVTYRVVKNRLARIAAKEAGAEELVDMLEGPTAIAVGPTDESALAKLFLDAVRPYKTVEIRGALLRGRRIDAAAVTRLAALPSREVLLARMAGAVVSPLSSMAGLLAAPLRDLGSVLRQLSEKREASEPAEAAAPSQTAEASTAAEATPAAEPEATPAAEATQAADPTQAAESSEPAEASQAAESEAPAEPATEAEAPEATAEAEAPGAALEAATEAATEAESAEAPEPEGAAETPEEDASDARSANADETTR